MLRHNKLSVVFVTVRLTVTAPVLRFCEDKNARQPCGFYLWQGDLETQGKTGRVVQTDSTKNLLMNAMVRECPSPEENTLQYLVQVCSSIEGSMAEEHAVIGSSGSPPSPARPMAHGRLQR